MKEIELTFLAKNLPFNLAGYKSKEIIDVYFPKNSLHPKIRLRKNGSKYELTKKQLLVPNNASIQEESIILLDVEEFLALSKLDGKKLRKIRYSYPYKGLIAEIDIFQDALLGLVLIDFEFSSEEELSAFEIPDFCLCDITQEDFIAGGMLAGKTYDDIKNGLNRFDYKKIMTDIKYLNDL